MPDNLLDNRLLVADDDPAMCRLVERVAEGLGFEVVVTEDPSTVLKTARGWHPTVLMLDLKMPGMDGIELLRGLAEDKCGAHVLLMSAAGEKVLDTAVELGRDRGLKMGPALHKPMQFDTIREVLLQLRPTQTTLLADLAAAIEADQLFLEYQLILDCGLARMTGVEALVRWRHPTLGIIPPDQFIPLAEETLLIHRLTDWVAAAATKQMAAWHAQNPALQVAFNISAKNLEDLDFPDRMHQCCLEAGVDSNSLTLELTETGTMREAVRLMDVLTRLRLKGFKLSIDDFGTGFSSLAQLQKMPFSEVKIDRSFVASMTHNEGCRAIVEIVIDLARKLKLKSVAEGVEDEAALRSLMALGCDAAQGYHLSSPVSADLIPAFISEYQMLRRASKAANAPFPSPFANARAWRRRRPPHTPLSDCLPALC
jgi:EAL domain-containing protein (putative c-di-GMP-specific phosphodiesterase class I)/CheY-like chemotaxis protein